MKTLKLLTLAAGLFTLFAGCEKLRSGGDVTVRMTDAPALYARVDVDIRSVDIHYSNKMGINGGWTTVKTRGGLYNLLDLQNGVTVIIADEEHLPVGKINQMRLVLGTKNSVTVSGGSTFPLHVSSGMESGIKLNLNTEIKSGSRTEITLDFDAGKSVADRGNGSFLLTPVIEVKSVSQR